MSDAGEQVKKQWISDYRLKAVEKWEKEEWNEWIHTHDIELKSCGEKRIMRLECGLVEKTRDG